MKSNEILIYVGATIIALLIYRVFIQWTFQIHKRNRLMEAQIKLLSRIAEKHGVSKDDIDGINSAAESKHQVLS